ncbi:MAG: hypothetical protein QOI38_1641 [Sphingomonadales bacterium]|jgi:hypothetical protein|nr:hypothetical protein [Sphingomonadales bacterium]
MLETLDVLVGFSLVMLIMSMAVTMVTQLLGSAVLNLRGRALKIGIARLLALLDRGFTPAEAHRLSDHLLRNPLVAPPAAIGGHRLAPVIHREELVSLILDFAANGDADRASDDEATDEEALRDKIRRSLAANGIAKPDEVLARVRNAVTELERRHPELSHSARLNMAMLEHAASDFLSKLNSWFDQSIDRVSDLFTSRIRLVTAGVAIVLAFFLQLDSISLLNRLSVDDDLRNRLVAAAIERAGGPAPAAVTGAGQPAAEGAAAVPAEPRSGPAAGTEPSGDASSEQAANTASPADAQPAPETAPAPQAPAPPTSLDSAIEQSGVSALEQFGLISLPVSWDDWVQGWNEGSGKSTRIPLRIFGILLTAALLSLGAPFWYSALRDMVRLRSMVARKDDAQRAERQTTQTAGEPTPGFAADIRGGGDGDGVGDGRET